MGLKSEHSDHDRQAAEIKTINLDMISLRPY
jgi:hypothetical protein